MSQAVAPDLENENDPTNANISNPAPMSPASVDKTDLKTADKMKLMASQLKTKSKQNAKKLAEKTKDRLSLEGQLRQARISLEKYVNPKLMNRPLREDTIIPKWVLKKAKGIVFLTVIKAGFLFAGNVGTGCVIVRKPGGGWTGPSSIAVAGVSFGFLAGASKVDYMMILPDDAAVKQFTGNGQLRLGGELQVALGPVGREGSGSVGAGDKGMSVIFSYSHAQGLYGGLAFDGKVISVRPDCNDKYYQQKVTCFEILTGDVEAPLNEDYDMIVHLLDSYCNDDLTPMKGERISIDDLDKQSDEFDDSKYDDNNTVRSSRSSRSGVTGVSGVSGASGASGSSGVTGMSSVSSRTPPQQRAPRTPKRTVDKNASEIIDEIGTKFQNGFNSIKSKIFKQDDNGYMRSEANSDENQYKPPVVK